MKRIVNVRATLRIPCTHCQADIDRLSELYADDHREFDKAFALLMADYAEVVVVRETGEGHIMEIEEACCHRHLPDTGDLNQEDEG